MRQKEILIETVNLGPIVDWLNRALISDFDSVNLARFKF